MRKPALAVVTIVAALLTGCSDGGPGEPPTPAAPPAAAGDVTSAAAGAVAPDSTAPAPSAGKGGDAALSADTEAICAQAGRAAVSFGKTFAEDYELLTQAAKEGAEAKARAREKVSRDVANFSHALLDMSKLAADPQVKKALAAMGAEVTALKGDITKIDDRRLAGLRSTLDKACGRG